MQAARINLQEHPFQRLLDAAADAMLVADADGTIVAANAAAARLFGCDPQALLQAAVEELMPERYRAAHRLMRARYAREPRVRAMGNAYEVRGLRRDGTEFFIEASLGPLDQGQVLVTLVDVTERRRASDALRKFARAIEQTASTVVITNSDGVIEYVNPRFVETTGYVAAEAIGRKPSLVKSGHTSTDEYRQLWRTIIGGGTWRGEFRNRRKDGSLYWESAIISPVRDERGDITHFVAVKDDVSAHKAMDAALRTSEQLRAAAFNSSSVGMAQIDPASRRLVAVNPALCRICGYSHAELLQMDVDRLNHPDDRLDPAKFDALLRGAGYEEEKRLVRKDGSVAWVHVSGSVVRDADARPVIVVGVVQDVTARRQAQEALAAREARQSFLVRLNDGLRRLDDPQQISFEAARMLGEFVGASRVGYAEDDGNGETITAARNYAAGVPAIEGCYRYDDYGAALLADLRAGRTNVRPDIANDPSLAAQEKAAHAVLQLGATVNVPLLKAQQLVAVFFVHAATARAWTAHEVALFEDVAERIRADIERARAEAALRTREGQLGLFIDHAPAALAMFDPQMRYLAVSRRWLEDYGLQAPVLGRSHYDVFPEIGSRWREVHRRCLGGATERCDEDRFDRADGTTQWLRWEVLPWRAATGAIGGIVIFSEDITERVQARPRSRNPKRASAPRSSRRRSESRIPIPAGAGCASTRSCARSPATAATNCCSGRSRTSRTPTTWPPTWRCCSGCSPAKSTTTPSTSAACARTARPTGSG